MWPRHPGHRLTMGHSGRSPSHPQIQSSHPSGGLRWTLNPPPHPGQPIPYKGLYHLTKSALCAHHTWPKVVSVHNWKLGVSDFNSIGEFVSAQGSYSKGTLSTKAGEIAHSLPLSGCQILCEPAWSHSSRRPGACLARWHVAGTTGAAASSGVCFDYGQLPTPAAYPQNWRSSSPHVQSD